MGETKNNRNGYWGMDENYGTTRLFPFRKHPVIEGTARAFHCEAWINEAEEEGTLPHVPGEDLTHYLPNTSEEAYGTAEVFWDNVWFGEEKATVEEALKRAMEADGVSFAEGSPEWNEYAYMFGWYVAMQALGHGVGWYDAHRLFSLSFPWVDSGRYIYPNAGRVVWA